MSTATELFINQYNTAVCKYTTLRQKIEKIQILEQEANQIYGEINQIVEKLFENKKLEEVIEYLTFIGYPDVEKKVRENLDKLQPPQKLLFYIHKSILRQVEREIIL